MKCNKLLVPAGQRKKNGLVKKIGAVLVALAVIGVIGSDPEEQGSVSTSALASVSSTDLSAFSEQLENSLTDGQTHLAFPDGGKYEGNLQDDQRSGQGTFTWADGSSYTGSWSADQMEGEGTFTGPDGTQWSGTFSGNAFQNGAAYHVIGNGFDGTITVADSVNQASLTFTCPDSTQPSQTITLTYTGDLTKTGELSGNATIGYPNGDSYTGTVASGKKTGGTYTFQNDDRYEGTFSEDKMCDGTYTFATGQTLQGHFEKGIPSGEMTYTVNGVSYKTTWSNGTCTGITNA